jgi:hypothetical protein
VKSLVESVSHYHHLLQGFLCRYGLVVACFVPWLRMIHIRSYWPYGCVVTWRATFFGDPGPLRRNLVPCSHRVAAFIPGAGLPGGDGSGHGRDPTTGRHRYHWRPGSDLVSDQHPVTWPRRVSTPDGTTPPGPGADLPGVQGAGMDVTHLQAADGLRGRGCFRPRPSPVSPRHGRER